METKAAAYLRTVSRLLERLPRINRRSLPRAIDLVARTLERDGLIHVFGTGHSSLLAQEAFFRAGGLLNVNPLISLSTMVYRRPLGAARIERRVEPAARILREHRFEPRDVAFLASHSGRNVLPVELALRLGKLGVPTIGISSLKHARTVPSRHPSGRRLVDVVDVVLDNGGVYGDAAIEIGPGVRMGPTSTIAAVALLHAVCTGAAARVLRKGLPVPVLESANVRGKRLSEYPRRFARYRERIRWLG